MVKGAGDGPSSAISPINLAAAAAQRASRNAQEIIPEGAGPAESGALSGARLRNER